uniref:Protein Ycf2 n=1 Tax=Cuscuta nitida TaxID=192831 RepID=A0A7H0DGE6_9ASTE|nr:Ycf2 protein [Cuscuta nitida]YP_009994341.1 Ycf2 protein [Cuscuta nitida]QNP08405.1 Ycf2 protein [Cuscuta nitida]QNP08406.1 Ycf2 protein [Cuscuta nitida]
MKKRQGKFWILELREIMREINRSQYFLDSWTQLNSVGSFFHIFFRQERFLKLFDPRILSLLLSRNFPGLTRNRYFNIKIKGVILFVVGILIYRLNNQNMVARKSLYLRGLLPIPLNCTGLKNHSFNQTSGLSNINKLSVLLLSFPKGKVKKISKSFLLNPKATNEVIPITKGGSRPESNWGSQRWRDLIGQKGNASFKEMLAGMDILFKENSSQSIEFSFVYYMDDLTKKESDWKRFSMGKVQNRTNFNSEPVLKLKRFVKSSISYLMSAFHEKLTQEGLKSTIQSNGIEHVSDLFWRKRGTLSLQTCAQFHMWQFYQDLFFSWGNFRPESYFFLSNVWLNKDRFFSKGRNIWFNLQYDFRRSRYSFVDVTNSSELQRFADKPRELFDFIRNEDSEYCVLMNQSEIKQRKERSSSWDPYFVKTERKEIKSERFPKRLSGYSRIFQFFTEREKQRISHWFPEDIQNSQGNATRSLYSFCSDRWSELYMASTPTERSTRDLKFSKKPLFFVRRAENKEILNLFQIILYLKKTVLIHSMSSDPEIESYNFKKNPLFDLVHRFLFELEDLLQERADLFTLSITEPDPVYHKGFSFYLNISLYGLEKTKLLNEVFNGRTDWTNQSLWVMSPILFWSQERYLENDSLSFFQRVRQNWVWIYYENGLIDIKKKMAFFAINIKNRMEAFNYYRWIQNRIQIQYSIYVYLRKNLLNSSTQKFPYLIHKIKGDEKGTTFLNPRTRMNYKMKFNYASRYKRSNGTNSFQEHLEQFLSEQKSFFQVDFLKFKGYFEVQKGRFQILFEQLRIDITQKWIYWLEVRKNVEKKVQKNVYKLIPFLLAKLSKSLRSFFLPQSLRFFFTKVLRFVTKWLFFLSNSLLFSCVSFGNTPIQRDKIFISELKGPNGQLCNQLLESIGFKIVFLRKLNPFVLEESGTSNFVINGAIRSPFGLNQIPKRMIDSLHTGKKSFYKNDYNFFQIFHDKENWLNSWNPFKRSSLISSFYKTNRLRFLNHPHHFWLYFNTRFPFSVERARNNNSYFLYGQFLNIWFFCNKMGCLRGGGKKEHLVRGRGTISPIESHVHNIFIPQSFCQNESQEFNLDKNFSSLMQVDPVIRRAVYSIIDTSATPLTEAQIVTLEQTYFKPFSDINRNLYDSKENNCYQYPNFISKMGLIHTPCSENFLSSEKNKKQGRIYTTFERESFFSILSDKWNRLKIYMPSFFTLTGYKYLNFIFFDLVSILSSRVSIFQDIFDLSWRILQINFWKLPFFSRKEISSKWLHHVLLSKEMIHRKSKLFTFYVNLFFVIVAVYLVTMQLLFVSRALSKLNTEFKRLNSFMSSSSMIEFRKLLDKYPMSEANDFWLTNIIVIVREQLVYFLQKMQGFVFGVNKITPRYFKNKNVNINVIDMITQMAVSIHHTRHLTHISPKSKAIYSFIRKRQNVNGDWIDDKIESWIANRDSIQEEERKFLVQLCALRTEERILLSLTYSDHLSKNDFSYKRSEQPGAIYLRNLVDIHQKHLMNYEFNTSRLAERRIFLAHSQTITYSQTWYGANSFHFPSQGKPFSLRLDLSPSRGILFIGSIGTGRSYLVKYLTTNSYAPFITVFLNKFLDKNPKLIADIYFENSTNIDASDDIDMEKSDNISENLDDDIDRDLATELDLLTWMNALAMDREMKAEIDRLSITLQFELARAMSPCIIWIPNIHDLDGNESNYLSLGVLVNHLSRDFEKCSPRNLLVIASTHIPQKVDPALIAPKKLNTCIKLRRLLSPQQRKSFFTLSYTRGFHLEKKMFHTNGFGSRTMGPNARDIVALTNEVLSISITQKKSIIDTNTIRFALHRQTWDLQSQVRMVQDHGILFYQIGRAVVQNLLIRNCPIDPISIYLKKKSCNEGDSYLYKWYFELGTSMKKLTILLYILSCSAGSVAQDLWSLPGPDEKNGITSYGLVENDSDLVHGLLEVEGALVGSSRMQNASSSIFDQRFLYQKYESEVEKGVFDPQQIEEDLFNHIVWAPRLWRPWGFLCIERILSDEEDKLQENDSELLQSGTLISSQSKTRDRSSKEKGLFQISQFIWDPADPLFFLFKDRPPGSVFSRREFFADEEMSNGLLTSQIEHLFLYKNTRLFINKTQEKHFKFLIHRQKWLRTNSSLSNGSFRSHTLSESYQYLSNLFLSNGTLLDQITNTLLRKRWLFPDEMQIGFM